MGRARRRAVRGRYGGRGAHRGGGALSLPLVEACKENLADPSDAGTDPNTKYSLITRLPRNQQEGDLPKIAVTSAVAIVAK
ncbi:MAG: hypothetical protein KF894_16715 [Labilithrix sp.]|nr:hypothetical protein [Labilithrix sp.]